MSIFKNEFSIPTPTWENDEVKTGTSSYDKLFESMEIRSSWANAANHAATKVAGGKTRYETIAHQTKVPWHVIGIIHLLEGDCNFRTHLHNGDSLSRRTVNEPGGRPRTGTPPFTWEESALDAIAFDKNKFVLPLNIIGNQLQSFEMFNGLGYKRKGVPSPYLWSGSNHYTKGKYVRDGVYDPNAVSQQVGAAVVLKAMQGLGLV